MKPGNNISYTLDICKYSLGKYKVYSQLNVTSYEEKQIKKLPTIGISESIKPGVWERSIHAEKNNGTRKFSCTLIRTLSTMNRNHRQ